MNGSPGLFTASFFIEKNPFPGTVPATGKAGLDHGLGLQIVQETAERLGGEMFCYTEQGSFVLDVMVRVDDKCNAKRS